MATVIMDCNTCQYSIYNTLDINDASCSKCLEAYAKDINGDSK